MDGFSVQGLLLGRWLGWAKGGWVAVLVIGVMVGSGACGGGDPAGAPERPAPSPTVAEESPEPQAAPSASSEPSATPSPTPEPTPIPTPVPRQARLSFSGDVLSHTSVFQQAGENGGDQLAYDYRPMFEPVRSRLSSADLAICHLETPLSPDNTSLSGYPIFNAPGDLAEALIYAGYDGCSTASNHSIDKGVAGVTATLNVMDQAGLVHAGMARTAEEAATPTLYEVNGIVIGHLSYTYGLNGLVLPEDKPWAVDVTSAEAVLAEARSAVESGAEFVILSIQWGAEYRVAPTSQQEGLAELFLASEDINLIIGTHAHVVQPIDQIGGEYVAYGLGNFLSNQSPQTCQSCPLGSEDGVVLEVELLEAVSGQIEVAAIWATPTWVDRRAFTILDAAAAVAEGSHPDLTARLAQSWERTITTLGSLGVAVTATTELPQ